MVSRFRCRTVHQAEVVAAYMGLAFTEKTLFDDLQTATSAELDAVSFGVIGMELDGTVVEYNAYESRAAGLKRVDVVGRNFFTQVALCTNNALVAQRFLTETQLDDIVDYVFAFHLRPVAVTLRLLKEAGAARMFLALQRA